MLIGPRLRVPQQLDSSHPGHFKNKKQFVLGGTAFEERRSKNAILLQI